MKNSAVVLALALLGARPALAQTTPSSSSVSGNPSGNVLKGQAPSGTSSTGSTNSPAAASGTPSAAKAQAGNASFSKNAASPTTPTRKTKSKM